MQNKNPKQSKKKPITKLRHQYEFADFVQWIALPKELRKPKTQRELAKKFGVGEDTLSEWKQREEFWGLVDEKRKSWGKERTPNVLMGLYNRAVKTGDPRAVRLWYEIVEGHRFNDKSCARCEEYEYDDISEEEIQEIIKKQIKFFTKQ